MADMVPNSVENCNGRRERYQFVYIQFDVHVLAWSNQPKPIHR